MSPLTIETRRARLLSLPLIGGLTIVMVAPACAKRDDPEGMGSEGGISSSSSGIPSSTGADASATMSSSGDGDGDGNGGDDGDKLDVLGAEDDGGGCMEGCLPECHIPPHTVCDSGSDLFNAMGLNCPGEPTVQGSTMGSQAAMGTRTGFGSTAAFAPREGSKFVVLGSGAVDEMDIAGLNCEDPILPGFPAACCNSDLGAFDPGTALPAPLDPTDVGAVTCFDDPALIGMGDCSNTLEDQWSAGSGANDYTELRFTVEVPMTVNSLSYDLAFFSFEYPDYFQSQFNDMYMGWLESETWTGNISFDEAGNPISLNAGFLDYKDASAANDPECAGGTCDAPELHGTCMEGHAGTKWLTSTAGVTPGETITMVFAVFDMSDSILDSYVFLDNFQWGCEGEAPPTTVPEG